jgi:hypothetical protein
MPTNEVYLKYRTPSQLTVCCRVTTTASEQQQQQLQQQWQCHYHLPHTDSYQESAVTRPSLYPLQGSDS